MEINIKIKTLTTGYTVSSTYRCEDKYCKTMKGVKREIEYIIRWFILDGA